MKITKMVKYIHCPSMKYKGTTVWPFIFYREPLNEFDKNHELIHVKQQLECWILPFFIIYFLSYIFNRARGLNHSEAYRNNIFEKEAYKYGDDLNYLEKRPPFNWV